MAVFLFILSLSALICPKLYGPKIHKSDVPLRPIVSRIGSLLHLLVKYLVKQLQPHTETISSNIKYSKHFVEILKRQKLNNNDISVSFDVISLFAEVPVTEAINVVEEKCHLERHIEYVKHCMSNTYIT